MFDNISVHHNHLKGWVLSAVLSPSMSFVLDSISSSLLETKICQKNNNKRYTVSPCYIVFFSVGQKKTDFTLNACEYWELVDAKPASIALLMHTGVWRAQDQRRVKVAWGEAESKSGFSLISQSITLLPSLLIISCNNLNIHYLSWQNVLTEWRLFSWSM